MFSTYFQRIFNFGSQISSSKSRISCDPITQSPIFCTYGNDRGILGEENEIIKVKHSIPFNNYKHENIENYSTPKQKETTYAQIVINGINKSHPERLSGLTYNNTIENTKGRAPLTRENKLYIDHQETIGGNYKKKYYPGERQQFLDNRKAYLHMLKSEMDIYDPKSADDYEYENLEARSIEFNQQVQYLYI